MGDRGGTATRPSSSPSRIPLYPMGDRGGTATVGRVQSQTRNYIRWEIGGEPQLVGTMGRGRVLYPMGDRGGTATYRGRGDVSAYYTRWEIGGEPQLRQSTRWSTVYYTRWEIGGEPQPALNVGPQISALYPMGDRGGTATTSPTIIRERQLYPMGDRGGTAT